MHILYELYLPSFDRPTGLMRFSLIVWSHLLSFNALEIWSCRLRIYAASRTSCILFDSRENS